MMPSMRARYASSRMTRNTWQPLVADLEYKTRRGDGKGFAQGVATAAVTVAVALNNERLHGIQLRLAGVLRTC